MLKFVLEMEENNVKRRTCWLLPLPDDKIKDSSKSK